MDTKDLLQTDREIIRKALGKTEADVLKDIKIIKDWVATQPHLPEMPSDNVIEYFLTNCKYSIEKTKQNLDMYYTIRDVFPHIYRGINPTTAPDMDMVYKIGEYVYLPKLTPSLYRICFVRYNETGDIKTDAVRSNNHFLVNVYEVRIHEDLSMGDIYIVDYDRLKFSSIASATPLLVKQYAFITEKVHSNRLKEVHLVKPPTFIAGFLALFKSFLSKKLQQRIIVHNNIEDLKKHFPIEMLPVEYGGKEKSLAELQELWKKKLQEYKDRFDTLDKLKVNEELRPEKLKNDEMLGYHGNFKKLDVD